MGRFEWLLGNAIEPLGLLSLARIAHEHHRVTLLDQRVERRFFALLKEKLALRPLLVGITSSAGTQLGNALEITRFVKRHSSAPVVFGGPFASQAIDACLAEPSVGYVVVGEGERVLQELADTLSLGGDPLAVPGVFGRGGGTVQQSFLDLDSLPEVPYQLLTSNRYFPLTFGRKTVSVETTRGCPHVCGYCYNTVVHRSRWRAMSPEKALAAVQHALAASDAEQIYFTDDNFFSDRARAFEIIRGLERLGKRWAVQGVCLEDVARMSDAELDLLKRSGCEGLFIGVQTGSARLHALFRTGLELDRLEPVNQRLARAGVPVWYFFMCGFPTETRQDLLDTVALAGRLLRDNPLALTSAFFLATPYPGTFLHERALEYGWPAHMSLDDWARTGWASSRLPWLDPEHKRLAESLYFLSLFHDRKAERFVHFAPMRAFARAYRPIARHRLQHLDLRAFGGEDMLRKIAFSVYFK